MKCQFTLLSVVLACCVAAVGCQSNTLPPAQMLSQPGPGVGGPGPGVTMPMMPPGGPMMGAMTGPPAESQIAFVGPDGMIVQWDVSAPGAFDSEPLVAPGRYNFGQGGIYRLKLTNIPGHEGTELYPTIEVGPATPRIEAYLDHAYIPVQFTEEDFDQVLTGNFVTKVIYLPDPEFQGLALAGVETLVSTRLDPSVDPIVEADRRGSILAIIRLGGKDQQLPGAKPAADGAMRPGGVVPVSYFRGAVMPAGYARPMMAAGPAGGYANGHVSGITMQNYGMPISGTPIGLAGPPHVPLGVPAGLRKHVIKNHTRVRLPKPTRKMSIHVRQTPGISYPKPVSRVDITERSYKPWNIFRNPFAGKHRIVQ